MTFLQVIFSVFDILFDFWPVLLLSPLRSRRRGNPIRAMLAFWGFWAFVRIALIFNPESSDASLFIPEPWSTVLFFVTGAILGVILGLQSYFRRGQLAKKAGRIRSREDLLNLSPVEFEEMVAALFRMRGHQARRTGRSGDHGVDVLIRSKKGEKWIVQCKRWRRPVGEDVVRDFYGVLQHEKASEGAIIALSGFSRPAQDWARGKPIHLISGDDFLKMWQKVSQRRRKV